MAKIKRAHTEIIRGRHMLRNYVQACVLPGVKEMLTERNNMHRFHFTLPFTRPPEGIRRLLSARSAYYATRLNANMRLNLVMIIHDSSSIHRTLRCSNSCLINAPVGASNEDIAECITCPSRAALATIPHLVAMLRCQSHPSLRAESRTVISSFVRRSSIVNVCS